MTAIPRDLLDAARKADATPAHVRPEDTARIARLIQERLPPEKEGIGSARLRELNRAAGYGRNGTHK